jgi:hypothetical protein
MITDEQKTKLNEIISTTNGMISRIDKGVVKGQESEDFFAEQIGMVKSIFTNTSDEWRIIDRWEHENNFQLYSMYKSGVYSGDKEKQKQLKLLDVLNSLIGSDSVNQEKSEWHFTANDAYEAKRFICDVFRLAGTNVMIVDEWLDDKFYEYVDIIPSTVSIQVITGETRPIFWTLYTDLKKKRSGVEARINNISHCRYIIIDDTIIYSTDASLNTIGKKDFMIHKLQDATEIEKVKNETREYWNNAKIK